MKHTFYMGFMQALFDKGAAETAKYARSLGFDSAEVLDGCGAYYPRISLTDAPAIRQRLEEGGLPVACYSVGAQLYGSDAVEVCLKRHADVAAALGSPYLHHTLIFARPSDGGPSFEDAMADLIPRAIRIADYARGLGLTVLYEDQGFYANGIEKFGSFYAAVKASCDNVGVCGDIGNILYADEEPEPFFRAYASDIRHVHIKDYRRSTEPQEGWKLTAGGNYLSACIFGEGVIDIPACLDILRGAGYHGAFGYEVECQPLTEGIIESMKYMRTIL